MLPINQAKQSECGTICCFMVTMKSLKKAVIGYTDFQNKGTKNVFECNKSSVVRKIERKLSSNLAGLLRARSPDDVKHTGVSKILSLFSCCSDWSPVKFKERKGNCDSHLADSAVEAGLHVVFALIAGVDKAVLALVVQLHQHTHSAPQGPAEWAELQVLVPGQSQEGVAAVHQVTGHQGVRVSNGGQRVKSGASN